MKKARNDSCDFTGMPLGMAFGNPAPQDFGNGYRSAFEKDDLSMGQESAQLKTKWTI